MPDLETGTVNLDKKHQIPVEYILLCIHDAKITINQIIPTQKKRQTSRNVVF